MTRERLDELTKEARNVELSYYGALELIAEVDRCWKRIEGLESTIGRANARLEGLMERRKEGR